MLVYYLFHQRFSKVLQMHINRDSAICLLNTVMNISDETRV